ncbi:probable peptide/nitrate transporter At3g43790 isoform X6 [Magnolia sinica]|uniref:probable peptide/nitrate transporter At3g43790 isoform X6 n=1 Tax=Magnolia sinica TaxID=86752 RepID=UPI00265A8266|nr:probable peptide/nitrate transporter At3g43790 isoform X6 [Magnolia sinica]
MAEIGIPLLEKVYYENCPGCRQDQINEKRRGIPFKEFFYIWIVILCTALPISSLFPFLYFMIRDFHIAKSEQDIGFYAGYVGSAFMIGRALTSILGGIIADRCGRKPVIIIGTVSVVVFNTLFGLSTSFWMAISMRFLLGCFNGLLGPIKAYASEVCRKEYQALALSIVSTAGGIGLIIGPALGGFLAQPAEKYPNIFSKKSLFGRFPYFLPCLCISLFALVVSIACYWIPIFSLWAISDRKYGGLSFSSENVGEVLAISGFCLLIFQLFLYSVVEKILGPIMLSRIAAILSIPLLSIYPFIAMLSGFSLTLLINCASVLKNVLSVTVITGMFLLQNNAVPQHQRGAANGISITAMSIFKTMGPAGGGALFAWAQKRQNASFLPGDQIVFFLLIVVEFIGVILTFKPFLTTPNT